MSESKRGKQGTPPQPLKPAPKIVDVGPFSTDYQTDPVDRFPLPTPRP